MLWLVSLSFAKNMKYSWMYQMSRLTYCCMFWCYKNRAVPYQQQMMHWQLWIEMFQCFIPREINEDCLFTFIQNDISVLKVKISHKVKFYLTVIQVCPFIYTSCESRKVTSLYLSSFNKNNKVPRHHWKNHKTLTDRQCFTLKPGLMPNLNVKAWECQVGMALIGISCMVWNLSVSSNYESEQNIHTVWHKENVDGKQIKKWHLASQIVENLSLNSYFQHGKILKYFVIFAVPIKQSF